MGYLVALDSDGQGGANPLSPSRGHTGEEEEDEDDEEFGGGDTLMSGARAAAKAEAEFSQQDTLVIREEVGVVTSYLEESGRNL